MPLFNVGQQTPAIQVLLRGGLAVARRPARRRKARKAVARAAPKRKRSVRAAARLVKGSAAAKRYMAKIRRKRK